MPRQPIYRRLGQRQTQADHEAGMGAYASRIERFVAETQVLMVYVEKSLRLQGAEVDLEGYRFSSRMVAERFAGAGAALVMGASVRPEDFGRLRGFQDEGDLQQAVLLDAVLSEKVDFALDFVEQEMRVELGRSGRRPGRRLSCGYGDFALEQQKYFYATLELARHGITLSDRFILSPEKTVTALLPIYQEKEDHA